MKRRPRREHGRGAWECALLLLALLPVLLFGPALGGVAACLHSHGSAGGHLHVLAAQIDQADLGALHEWHDAHHRKSHASGAHEQERGPTPDGLLIELPQVLAAFSRGTTSAPRVHVLALLAAPRWTPKQLALHDGTRRPDRCRSASPPWRTRRSGVAALLRTSHAILI